MDYELGQEEGVLFVEEINGRCAECDITHSKRTISARIEGELEGHGRGL